MAKGTLLVLLALVLRASLAAAQDAWDQYKSGTLQAVIDAHIEQVKGTGKPGQPHWALTGDNFPTRVNVTYTGRSRPLSPVCAEILRLWVKSFGVDPRALDMFGTEYLFREGESDRWLAVQDVLIPYFHDELSPGGTVTLFVRWIGAHYDGGKVTWCFIVNEFLKPESGA